MSTAASAPLTRIRMDEYKFYHIFYNHDRGLKVIKWYNKLVNSLVFSAIRLKFYVERERAHQLQLLTARFTARLESLPLI